MILKHLYLFLNTTEYPDSLVTEFGFRTRYVCNFIERRLKSEKFMADGFSAICVRGREVPDEGVRVVSENALRIDVYFDRSRYEHLVNDEFHEFFIDMLERSLHKCQYSHAIPDSAILSAIEEFRSCGYKNQ